MPRKRRPTLVHELPSALDRAGVDRHRYIVVPFAIDDRIVLDVVDGEWLVYYSERGEQKHVKRFATQSEACEYFYTLLTS